MTEASDAWKELHRRATESEFGGISADSDDLVDDTELREAPINPNASGGKGKGAGNGMAPPPMMMGGAGAGGGAGAAAGAQGAMGATAAAAGQMNAANAGAMGTAGAMRGAAATPGGLGAGSGMGPVPGAGAGTGAPGGVLAAGGESGLGGIPGDWKPGDPILPGDPRHPGGDIGPIFPSDPQYGDMVPGWNDGVFGDPTDPSSWRVPTGYDPNDPSTWGNTPIGGVQPSDGNPWRYGDPVLPEGPRHPDGSGPVLPHDPRYPDGSRPVQPGDPRYNQAVHGPDGGVGDTGSWRHVNTPRHENMPTSPSQGTGTDGRSSSSLHASDRGAPTPDLSQSSSGYPTGTSTGINTPMPTTDTGSNPNLDSSRERRNVGKDTSFSVNHAQLREWAKKWQRTSDSTSALQRLMTPSKDFGFVHAALPAAQGLMNSLSDWSAEASGEFGQIGESLIAAANNYEEQEGYGVRESNQMETK